MSELRRDPVVDRWVIIENTDTWGPENYEKTNNSPRDVARSPFIYKREHITPPEIEAIREEGTQVNTPGWLVRVVPNKFPALAIEGKLDPQENGIYGQLNGVGAHEVIIETPDAAKQFADYSIDEVVNVLSIYQRRYLDLTKDKRFKYIMIFKNFGESAGTSIEHAHSQLIALPMIPKSVEEKLEGCEEYYKTNNRSIYEDIVKQEKADQERIINENDDFISFAPYVPRYPFESWIMPKSDGLKFQTINGDQLRNLADILKDNLSRLKSVLSNPSFNFYLHLEPVNCEFEKSFRWHLEVVPKLSSITEFDWDTGFYVVRTPPKMAAKYLREAVIST